MNKNKTVLVAVDGSPVADLAFRTAMAQTYALPFLSFTHIVIFCLDQVGFGHPTGDLLPMYSCHWNPGPNRHLYVWDAKTGETRVALSFAAGGAQHGE